MSSNEWAAWFGALGQWLAAGATVWAVTVALQAAAREKKARRQMAQQHHDAVMAEVYLDEWVSRGAVGLLLKATNKGLGPAKNVIITVTLTTEGAGDLKQGTGPKTPFVLGVDDTTGYEWEWNSIAPEVVGVIRLLYSGLYGAQYQKHYHFKLIAAGGHSFKCTETAPVYPTVG